jgi:hypothetical protein
VQALEYLRYTGRQGLSRSRLLHITLHFRKMSAWILRLPLSATQPFRRLLLRFERLSHLHYALKTLAYTMINLRHYCRS